MLMALIPTWEKQYTWTQYYSYELLEVEMANYDKTIWNFLLNKIGNEKGVAGLMGNLYAESALLPTNVQNGFGWTDEDYTSGVDNGTYTESQFVNDEIGYGLAQWTYYSRKQALYDLYISGGYDSIGNINLQLNYLWDELNESYNGVLSTLKTCDSVRTASDKVLHDFENPAVQDSSVEEYRYDLSMKFYNEYSGTGGSGGIGSSFISIRRNKYNFILFKTHKRLNRMKRNGGGTW